MDEFRRGYVQLLDETDIEIEIEHFGTEVLSVIQQVEEQKDQCRRGHMLPRLDQQYFLIVTSGLDDDQKKQAFRYIQKATYHDYLSVLTSQGWRQDRYYGSLGLASIIIAALLAAFAPSMNFSISQLVFNHEQGLKLGLAATLLVIALLIAVILFSVYVVLRTIVRNHHSSSKALAHKPGYLVLPV